MQTLQLDQGGSTSFPASMMYFGTRTRMATAKPSFPLLVLWLAPTSIHMHRAIATGKTAVTCLLAPTLKAYEIDCMLSGMQESLTGCRRSPTETYLRHQRQRNDLESRMKSKIQNPYGVFAQLQVKPLPNI